MTTLDGSPAYRFACLPAFRYWFADGAEPHPFHTCALAPAVTILLDYHYAFTTPPAPTTFIMPRCCSVNVLADGHSARLIFQLQALPRFMVDWT